jgi:sulfur-oxidizing protein SoxX
MRITFLVLLVFPLACGCMPSPKSGHGFTLPDGNAEQGQKTFVQLQCHACHSVEGVEFEKLETPSEERMVVLGGETTYVRNYGNLVTSIINPSHRFSLGYKDQEIKTEEGESKMRRYNDEMTVTQLTDLVAFLQGRYKVIPNQPTPYTPYH